MGMYDSITIQCPHCGEFIEEQSKAGDCHLGWYTLDTAPVDILRDLADQELWCTHCHHQYKLMLYTTTRAVATKMDCLDPTSPNGV